MLYKVNLYNLKEGRVIKDSDLVDTIIVEKKDDGEVRDVYYNNKVVVASYCPGLEKYAVCDGDYESLKEDLESVGVGPCIMESDINDSNKVMIGDVQDYNPELTDYILNLDNNFYSKYMALKNNKYAKFLVKSK